MILSIDSSAITASVALLEADGTCIKNEFIKSGLTHSETLLPMINKVLDGIDFNKINRIAINNGPGSFTGIRIGVATAKGLAFKNNIPCVGTSTLESIAYNFIECDNIVVCAVMDARRNQFYNALFSIENNKVNRICDDRAISYEDLVNELVSIDKQIIIAGDGAKLLMSQINIENCLIAKEDKVFQNAIGVGLASLSYESIPSCDLVPVYLRPSQAERELSIKLKKE